MPAALARRAAAYACAAFLTRHAASGAEKKAPVHGPAAHGAGGAGSRQGRGYGQALKGKGQKAQPGSRAWQRDRSAKGDGRRSWNFSYVPPGVCSPAHCRVCHHGMLDAGNALAVRCVCKPSWPFRLQRRLRVPHPSLLGSARSLTVSNLHLLVLQWVFRREKKPAMPWTYCRREEIDAYLVSRSFGIYALMTFLVGEGFWYNRIRRRKMEYVVSAPAIPRPSRVFSGSCFSASCWLGTRRFGAQNLLS